MSELPLPITPTPPCCLSCGAIKDMSKLEIYPYPEDETLADDPIDPLLDIDCQPSISPGHYRKAILCHECWHRLHILTNGIDMWISQRCWESLNPITPFDLLPISTPIS